MKTGLLSFAAMLLSSGIILAQTTSETVHSPNVSVNNPVGIVAQPVLDEELMPFADNFTAFQHISLRGSLSNSLAAITGKKKATVAFFGGSITQMRGWRDQTEDLLRNKFPDTEFTFIEAGIASLGSTPHAFRMQEDVFGKGTPDLLFVEAAVNDHTNGFGPREQVLGMEGIVRHALKVNPYMDIVILSFIYDPFIPMYENGEQPDVILNHERVANHYHLTSINCAQEIAERMQAGQFDWKRFGGTHPSWFGHKFYTAGICRVLESNVSPDGEYVRKPHGLPEPIEPKCYENGKLLPLSAAGKLRNFKLEENWTPLEKFETRKGFVNVPMLVSGGKSSLQLEFDGNAVGLYCVCGPASGKVLFRIDGGQWQSVDTHTEWSDFLYLPWTKMLADGLSDGHHVLELRIPEGSPEEACIIRNFVVNEICLKTGKSE